MMNIYLIRHGQTTAKDPYRIFGQQEIPLSQEGIEQMKGLQGVRCERVFSSTLERAKKSASIVSQGVLPISYDTRLAEIDFGAYGGKDVRNARDVFPDKYRSTLSAEVPFPEGESLLHVARRVQAFHDTLLKSGLQSACIVSHQWLLNIYMKILLNIPLDEKNVFIFEQGKVSLIKIGEEGASVVGHNFKTQTLLDPHDVRDEFNRRARARNGIDAVLTDRYASDTNKQFNANVTHLLNTDLPGPFTSVIEFGVGMGRLTDFFAEKAQSIVGVDFSEEMLSLARNRTTNKSHVTLIQDDAATVDLGDRHFGLGIASLVLKHNSDERAQMIIEKLKKHCDTVLLVEHVRGGALGSAIAMVRDEEWYLRAFAPFAPTAHHRFMRGDDHMIFTVFRR